MPSLNETVTVILAVLAIILALMGILITAKVLRDKIAASAEENQHIPLRSDPPGRIESDPPRGSNRFDSQKPSPVRNAGTDTADDWDKLGKRLNRLKDPDDKFDISDT
jgi:hypothetical protein